MVMKNATATGVLGGQRLTPKMAERLRVLAELERLVGDNVIPGVDRRWPYLVTELKRVPTAALRSLVYRIPRAIETTVQEDREAAAG